LFQNGSLSASLEQEINIQPALVPALSWVHAGTPAKPGLFLTGYTSGNLRLWLGKSSQESQSRWWLLQTRSAGAWTTEILPGTARMKSLGTGQPDVIALTLVNQYGNASPAVVIEKKPPGASTPVVRDENRVAK